MKKVLLTLLLALALPVAAAEAQNIALGERVPEVKVPAWLRGETRRHPRPDVRRVFPLVEPGLHRVARTAPGDNRQIRRQTPRRGRHAGKRGENRPPAFAVPLAAHLRRAGHRGQDILGVQRAVRPVRGAGRQPEPGAVDGQLTAADTRNHRKIK